MLKKLLISATAFGLIASSAYAQTAPAPIASVQPPKPAATAGARTPVLVADITYVLLMSDAGKYRAAEMDKIRAAIQKEVEPQANALKAEQDRIAKIEDDIAKLEKAITDKGGVPQKDGDFLKKYGDYQTQLNGYQKKENDFSRLYQFAIADIKATDEASIRELGKALNPVIKSLVASKNADILLNASPQSIAYFVDSVDVSDELLAKFNSATKTVPVSRVKVPREAPAQANPAAGAPATPKKPAAPQKVQ